jgi:hypothetical protein
MKDNIIKLVQNDLNLSRYLHCLRSNLSINADALSTENVIVILSLMRIQPKEEVLNEYFNLIESVNKGRGATGQISERIFDYLVKCQLDPDLVVETKFPLSIGILEVSYSGLVK